MLDLKVTVLVFYLDFSIRTSSGLLKLIGITYSVYLTLVRGLRTGSTDIYRGIV
jgi:hypothetical protein